jgi:isochorismate hydrolase
MERFFIEHQETVLTIIDIQDRLAAAMSQKDRVLGNCLHLIELAKLLRIPILLTEQYPRGLGATVGAIREALPTYSPLEKVAFDSCREAVFSQAVSTTGRKTFLLTGMETHICVLQTGLGLLRKGYAVHLVQDAVCSRTKDNHRAGLAFLRQAGAVITSTETVLFQLLEKAGTEAFKVISKRIK